MRESSRSELALLLSVRDDPLEAGERRVDLLDAFLR
jgi:hypothetical protein